MARTRKGFKIDGWINLDKPSGMGSTPALAKVRRLLNAQKAGHAGTLDPLASGILPIALGEATKTIPYMQDSLKTYEFTVRWGERRSTDDSEGEILETSPHRPSDADILALLSRYTGEILQVPPQVSALKIDGHRAYDLAREGEVLDLAPRQVFIESLRLERQQTPDTASFVMTCGKGTYVRSLARDMGQDLGCHGHIIALRRVAVGPFTAESAISLDRLAEIVDSAPASPEGLGAVLWPIESALDDIPALPLSVEEAARLQNGQVLSFVSRGDFHRIETIRDTTALALCKGRPVGLVDIQGAQVKPARLFNL